MRKSYSVVLLLISVIFISIGYQMIGEQDLLNEYYTLGDWMLHNWPILACLLGFELFIYSACNLYIGYHEKIKTAVSRNLVPVGLLILVALLIGGFVFLGQDANRVAQQEEVTYDDIDGKFPLPSTVKEMKLIFSDGEFKVQGQTTANELEVFSVFGDSNFKEVVDHAYKLNKNETQASLTIHADELGEVIVKIPNDIMVNVDITGGNLSMENIDQKVAVSHAEGGIKISSIKGNVSISHQGSGQIELSKIFGDVNVTGDAENIRLNDVQGKVNIHAVDGHIIVENSLIQKEGNITTYRGDILLSFTENPNSNITVSMQKDRTKKVYRLGRPENQIFAASHYGNVTILKEY